MTNQEQTRYSRHLLPPEIGVEGQAKLKNASVFVIGAGGLGCPALLYMAAAGVGRIGIADFDVVDETNLQRQVLYTTADVGFSKATRAKERLNALNPFVQIEAHALKISRENILSLLQDYDIIVDGSDNFATRYLVNDACVLLNKPLVFGSIFKFEGQLSVFNYNNGPTYRCLYAESPKEGEMPNCSDIGVLGVLPGIVGTLQANEVLKIITGIGEVLSGRLLLFDALSMTFNTIAFQPVEENKKITALIDYEAFCGIGNRMQVSKEVLKKKIYNKEEFQLIDVRSQEEFERFNIGGKLIPLPELEARRNELAPDIEMILVCQSGKRSEAAVSILTKYGYTKVASLIGGVVHFD